ncbi:hypothetical protein [Candidatus Nitronereus thalassa]|uniref:Uncharacterized protein n=1 Tax=Candidatus Nitronereus thalassa TaxID=3020898 RepID=A0ABU3K4S3_9BACT|nr:hypothetical protein [Candidatus Nitronereus thalassa]MDT7041399.1 hypothetical protein [Candidatus Nitronereus thalassa]
MEQTPEQEKDILFATRDKDGAVTLYADEEWAIERGADPSNLHMVEIPRELYAKGTIQEVREFVASYLEEQQEQSS